MTRGQPTRTRDCSPSEARGRRDRARAFLEIAELVLDEGPREAHVAASLAVLSGIASADAICGLKLGRWSRGPNHERAVDLLEQVSLRDMSLPNKLRRLLSEKDAAHYSPNVVTEKQAADMVRWANALLDEAESL